MSQLIRNVRSWALFRVSHKSDFWIQRTNPFDPAFSDNEMYKELEESIRKIFPEHAGKADALIRSAILSAMDKEKADRISQMRWDPYGTKYGGSDCLFSEMALKA